MNKMRPTCLNVVYRDDPPQEVFIQLMRSAYASDLWSLAETDFCMWKRVFGRRFHMLVAYDEASFYPIGCICSATYNHRRRNAKTTVLGLYYVRKEFRGKGIGNELFRRIISNKKDHNLYLNGMSYMVEKYRIHYDFVVTTPWRVVWYQIRPQDVCQDTPSSTHDDHVTILPVTMTNLPCLLDYDSSLQGDLDRTAYIQAFVMQPCADSKLAFCEGKTVGVGVARLLINDELFIGPLYADTFEIARALLYSLLHGRYLGHYRNVQMQIPSVNESGSRLVEEISRGRCMTDDFTQGLSTKFRVDTDPSRIYSTTEYDVSIV
ncbi:hypothetical protein Y032_0439g1488 [Ancylostoma ceylanicum]|nr:hypothetical protein Y032_0439g1488 [Ancylostoma ceylanicum]